MTNKKIRDNIASCDVLEWLRTKGIVIAADADDNKSLEKTLFNMILGDSFYYEFRALMLNQTKPLNQIASELRMDINDLTDFIAVASNAQVSGDKLFEARYHMFLRGIEGVYVTLNPDRHLFVRKMETCKEDPFSDDCGYKVFAISFCHNCNATFIVGQTEDGYLVQKSKFNDDYEPEVYLLEGDYDESEIDEAEADLRELMNIPDNYKVLFLQGGASQQFAMIPMNLALPGKPMEFADTGVWSSKAIKEAKLFGEVKTIASSKEDKYTYIPDPASMKPSDDASFFHITSNNTIYGTEIRKDLDSPIPMIADMSSDIFSRPVDVSKYICIYGGAQKNLAPAGATFVIVKDEALNKVSRYIPTMLKYQTHVDGGSMFNTPPVLPIYSALQTLRWIKKEGGVEEMQRRAKERADLLYGEIDRNKLFRATIADPEDRSYMNICFVMNDEYKELEADFMKFATDRGMVGIKGHRSVGGFRASCYNALPLEAVQALVDCMKEFEKNH